MSLCHILNIFIKEEWKFSKQENDLVNSNTENIKSLKKLEFLKQKLVNKNKLIKLYTSKVFGNGKGSNIMIYQLWIQTWLMKLSINFCRTILDSSVSKTVQSGSNLSTPQISEEYDQ